MPLTLTRNTRQRSVIRDVFEEADRPLGAQEVLDLSREDLEGMGIATVYRTIKVLLEEGWLVPVELPGESPRYELAGKDHHHHFHCHHCGKVYEMPGCIDELKRMVPPGFHVSGHEVTFYGLCSTCTQLKKRSVKVLVGRN